MEWKNLVLKDAHLTYLFWLRIIVLSRKLERKLKMYTRKNWWIQQQLQKRFAVWRETVFDAKINIESAHILKFGKFILNLKAGTRNYRIISFTILEEYVENTSIFDLKQPLRDFCCDMWPTQYVDIKSNSKTCSKVFWASR